MEKTKLGKKDIFTPLKEKTQKAKDERVNKFTSKNKSFVPFQGEQKKRQTYHMRVDLIPRIKEYAYFERFDISEVVNAAVERFLKGYKPKMRSKPVN
jgi:hypothetical protein